MGDLSNKGADLLKDVADKLLDETKELGKTAVAQIKGQSRQQDDQKQLEALKVKDACQTRQALEKELAKLAKLRALKSGPAVPSSQVTLSSETIPQIKRLKLTSPAKLNWPEVVGNKGKG